MAIVRARCSNPLTRRRVASHSEESFRHFRASRSGASSHLKHEARQLALSLNCLQGVPQRWQHSPDRSMLDSGSLHGANNRSSRHLCRPTVIFPGMGAVTASWRALAGLPSSSWHVDCYEIGRNPEQRTFAGDLDAEIYGVNATSDRDSAPCQPRLVPCSGSHHSTSRHAFLLLQSQMRPLHSTQRLYVRCTTNAVVYTSGGLLWRIWVNCCGRSV